MDGLILTSTPPPRHTPAARWIYPLAWVPYIGIYTAALVANDLGVPLALRNALANLLPPAVLGFFVLGLPRRFPWSGPGHSRFLSIHLGSFLAFLVLSQVFWIVLVVTDGYLFEGHFSLDLNHRFLPWRIMNDVLVYVALTAVAYAWHYAVAHREQAERAAHAEALRARADLQNLRNQLNPHFLLNTLHTLIGLVRREPGTAEVALERLGDLLRRNLRVERAGQDETTLREELAFVETYVAIETLRFGKRLRVQFEADPATQDCRVPTFVIQTLVENAVRHAIAPRSKGGSITVTARRSNGALLLVVQDDGPGLEAREATAEGSPAESGTESPGVGLTLLRERLDVLYEGRAKLTVASSHRGVRATIELPVSESRST